MQTEQGKRGYGLVHAVMAERNPARRCELLVALSRCLSTLDAAAAQGERLRTSLNEQGVGAVFSALENMGVSSLALGDAPELTVNDLVEEAL